MSRTEGPTVESGASRKLADVAVGAAGALVVFAAVPSVLALLVGDPLPTHWTRAALISLHGLFALLAIVAWCAWATCAWSLSRAVIARVRTRDTSNTPRLVDQLAVRIAVAILAVAPAGIASAGGTAGASTRPIPAATAPPTGSVVTVPSASLDTSWPDTISEHPLRAERRTSPSPLTVATHLVADGETLWEIAEHWYGEGSAWHAIAATNLGRVMIDGTRFVDPAHPGPGWRLGVPSLGATALSSPLLPEGSSPGALPAHQEPPRGSPPPLPELAALGVGTLVAALLARRAREQRMLRSLSRREGDPTPAPEERDVNLAAQLVPFERSPLLEWVEHGLCQLTVAARALGSPLPAVAWMRVGSVGLDVHFAGEPPPAPAPWVPAGPTRWRLPARVDLVANLAVTAGEPWCPVVVPVGDDTDATWLLPIAPGTCLAVLGPLAGAMTRAMEVAARRWRWAAALAVTDDVDTVVAALEDAGAGQTGAGQTGAGQPGAVGGPHVLFVGDQRVLPVGVRERVSVLGTEVCADAPASVFVDHRAATVHPFGVALRPHLLGETWAAPVAQVSPPASGARDVRGAGPAHRPSALRHRPVPAATARVARAMEPALQGPVDVRLLVPVPRIDGLQAALPPNRARRAVELITYLALHSPDPVTGDRLRTRVLGTADIDAAAKTLFNTVHAARRALGRGPDGAPLLPPASRGGHYQISPLVTVDSRRASALLEAALGSDDLMASLSLIERALALVHGEPLGGVLTGYAWWRAEGHERRLADLVVDGACALVRGSIATGHVDRARWAIAAARQVECYSEALTRAAMEVAAAAGDATRLHAEWIECCRQVDELDPGGTPSRVTECLYARLRGELGVDRGRQDAAPIRA